MITVDDILRANGLQKTGCRKGILEALLRHQTAMSENELKATFPDLFDRVTFYRTLKTLEEKAIIHKIVVNDQTVKYALNEQTDATPHHSHFHCASCDEVVCMHSLPQPTAQLPEGYVQQDVSVIIEGLCPSCAHQHTPPTK